MTLILQQKQLITEFSLFFQHYYAFSLAYKSKSKGDMENLFLQALYILMQNQKKITNFFLNHYLCHFFCSKNSNFSACLLFLLQNNWQVYYNKKTFFCFFQQIIVNCRAYKKDFANLRFLWSQHMPKVKNRQNTTKKHTKYIFCTIAHKIKSKGDTENMFL